MNGNKIKLAAVEFRMMTAAEVRDAMMLATNHPQIFDALLNIVMAQREDWVTRAKTAAEDRVDTAREVGAVEACDMLIVNIGAQRDGAIYPDGKLS